MKFILNNGSEHHDFEIPHGTIIIGRDPSCDLTINSQTISRRHAECLREGNVVRLRDLNSANGTHVNGMRIRTPVILKVDDAVKIGDISLTFVQDQSSSAAGFAPPPQEAPFQMEPEIAQPGMMPNDNDAEDEHTPADGTFMPEVYRPEGPPQPLITQRDGRWYLRDPRTNREVEIVPKAQSEPGTSSDEKRNKLLTYVIVGIAALLAVVIVGSALSSRDPVQANEQQRAVVAEYDSALMQTIELYRDGNFDEAIELLTRAERLIPRRAAARTFRDYVQTVAAAGEHLAELDYQKATQLLENLQREAPMSAIEVFTRSEQSRVDNIYGASIRLNMARRYAAEGKLHDAFTTADSVPLNNPVRAAHEGFIRDLRERVKQMEITEGDEWFAARRWEQAIAHYERADKYSPGEFRDKIMAARKAQDDQKIFEAAEQRFRANEHTEAITLLQGIDRDSPYHTDAQRMRTRITTEREEHHARSLYRAGRAEDAMLHIRKHQLQSLFDEMKKMDSVLKAYQEATRADERGAVSEAIAGFAHVINLETNPENFYHRTARIRHEALSGDRQALAAEFLQKANEAFRAREFTTARRHARRAFELDGRSGKEMIEQLDRDAQAASVRGNVHLTRGEKEQAAAQFKLVTQLAEPGSFHYNHALRALRDLEAENR